MFANLRYYLPLIACTVCLMPSCSSDIPDKMDVIQGTEISFALSALSRADETTPAFTKFAIYGDKKHVSDENPTGVFNKTVVEYINGSWSYNGVQYWFPKHEHTFVAVHPLSVSQADNKPQYSNSKLSFTYSIPTSEDNKVFKTGDVSDIIVATHRRLYDENDPNTTVNLKFGHIMSKINIAPALDDNIMSSEEYIEMQKLELSGFKTKASFNILPAPRQSNSQTDDRVTDITALQGTGNLSIEFKEPVKIVNDKKNVSLFADNAAIIMIPQSFDDASDAKIILSYKINEEAEIKQISIPLINMKWDSGKSYTYKFTISRKGVIFNSTTISDWEVLNVGNIDVR